MLRQTFCHIQGVGRETERKLWDQGCHSWETYLETPDEFNLNGAAKEVVLWSVENSLNALTHGDYQFFQKHLSQGDVWRAFPEFRSKCVYLDIETDGGRFGHAVTCIGLYDGETFDCLIKGDNLESFRDIISNYSMVITFFGTMFDLPMLEKCFSGFKFDQIHLDLCFALKRVGFSGGLKKIEKQTGIARGLDTEGMSGLDAVRLWNRYQLGDQAALEKLIAYNREDVVNLEKLADIAYEKLKKQLLENPVEADERVKATTIRSRSRRTARR